MSVSSIAAIFSVAPDLAEAHRVLDLEIEALRELNATLNDDFVKAVDCLDQLKGRVVVTGMGKSGHIARKIAATLASTGTPAIFVHPAEASHGDLGMVTSDDAVLALSNSGETSELSHILRYVKGHGIPLIALTSIAHSTLAHAADICLCLPEIKEACPIGLAPTTSTTMMLAMGDALACVLLKRKNFSADDFGKFHPSGALGKRLLTVQDIMLVGEDMPTVAAGVSMGEAIIEMSQKGKGCVGVVDPTQQLLGVITDGDIRRHMASDLMVRPVSEIMTTGPKTIHKNALIVEAVAVMNQQGITGLFVCEKDSTTPQLAGFVHLHDCLRVC